MAKKSTTTTTPTTNNTTTNNNTDNKTKNNNKKVEKTPNKNVPTTTTTADTPLKKDVAVTVANIKKNNNTGKKSKTTTATATTSTTPSTSESTNNKNNETTTTTTTNSSSSSPSSSSTTTTTPTVSIFGSVSSTSSNSDVMNAFSSSNAFEEKQSQPQEEIDETSTDKKEPKVELGPHGKPILTDEEKKKRKDQDLKVREEEDKRTVFLSNVDLLTKPRELKQFFSKYGKISTVRLRSISTESQDSNRKDSYINKKFNEKRETCNAYVVFEKEEDAKKVVAEANGTLFKDRHLYVDLASHKHSKGDDESTVFIGNVPFESENEDIFQLFDHTFGGVESVRLVRDGQTGQGKGFGYVLFEKKKYAKIAIKAKSIKMNERDIRIFPNKQNPKGKNVKKTPAAGAPVKHKKPAMKKKPSTK